MPRKGKQLGLELPEEFREKEVVRLPIPEVTFDYVTSLDVARETLKRLHKLTFEALGVDIETTALNPHDGDIRLIQLAIPDWPVVVLDCLHIGGVHLIADLLTELFKGRRKVAQNAVFECKWLTHNGVEFEIPLFDTMIADQLINCGQPNKPANLAAIMERYLGLYIPKEEQVSDWSRSKLDDEQLEYAARDAFILLPLRKELLSRLAKAGLLEVSVIEMSAIPAFAAMERSGLQFDWKVLNSSLKSVESDREVARKEFLNLINEVLISKKKVPLDRDLFGDYVINIDSPEQLSELFNSAGLSLETTDQRYLKKVDEPLISSYLFYKNLETQTRDFAKYIKHENPKTKRVHPGFTQILNTGRTSCKQPNVQQISKGGVFRKAVIASEGWTLVCADYSQIEPRIIAEHTGDKVLIDVYQRGLDVYQITAIKVMGYSEEFIYSGTKEAKAARNRSKPVKLAYMYAQSAKGFQSYAKTTFGMDFTDEEAYKLRDNYFKTYPGIAAWHRQLESDALATAYSKTKSGRIRFLPFKDRRINILANNPIQGLAADIAKSALGLLIQRLKPYGKLVEIVNFVHDEILVHCVEHLADEVGAILSACMVEAGQRYLKVVPVEADYGIGPNWKAAKK
jgi:DNA polymerase I-like protein with 3'-5' exonuclease and polymerase domains